MGNALVLEMGFCPPGGGPHVRAGGQGSRSASPTPAHTRAGGGAGSGSGSGSGSRSGSVSGDESDTDALVSRSSLERRTGGAPDLFGNRAHCLLDHRADCLSLLASYRGAERRGSREGGVWGAGARQVHERECMCLGGVGWRLVQILRYMCVTPCVRKAMYISIGLQIWQQVSGGVVNVFEDIDSCTSPPLCVCVCVCVCEREREREREREFGSRLGAGGRLAEPMSFCTSVPIF
jgi:hypothetical protein